MSNHKKRVLIVEDEVFVAMSLAMDLRSAGHEVAATQAFGEAAVAYLRENSVDLVLMDIGLAGDMDGVQAASLMRSFSAVPIIFMTGYANRENDSELKQIQPLAFLVKPVPLSRLQPLLGKI